MRGNWFFYMKQCEISSIIRTMSTYLKISKIRFIIYRSDLNNLQTWLKKAKKYQLVGIALSMHDNTKSPQTYIMSQFRHMSHKHVVQFTEPIPTIYWYAKRNKLTLLNMPVLNTIQ